MPPPTTRTGSRFSFALITLYSSVGISRDRHGVKRTGGRELRYLDHLAARVPERFAFDRRPGCPAHRAERSKLVWRVRKSRPFSRPSGKRAFLAKQPPPKKIA